MKKVDAFRMWRAAGFDGEPSELGFGLWGRAVPINPEMAQKILDEYNQHNRKMKDSSIAAWIQDMTHDRWFLTHQGIGFGEDGQLQDGQNRLQAVVNSKTTQRFLVVFGLQKEAMTCLDQAVSRNLRDVVTVMGLDPSITQMGPVIKKLYQGGKRLTSRISNPLALQLIAENEEIALWVKKNVPNVSGVTSTKLFQGCVGRIYKSIRGNNAKVHILMNFLATLADQQWTQRGDVYKNASGLRDYLLTHKMYGRQSPHWKVVEYAIGETLDGRIIRRWPQVEMFAQLPTERFPLEGDEEEAA